MMTGGPPLMMQQVGMPPGPHRGTLAGIRPGSMSNGPLNSVPHTAMRIQNPGPPQQVFTTARVPAPRLPV